MPKLGYREHYRRRIDKKNVARSQDVIVEAVCNGDFLPIILHPVTVKKGPYEAVFFGATDALAIGKAEDSVRVNVSHEAIQAIADVLKMVVPTPTLLDAMADQAPIQVDVMGMNLDKRRYDGKNGSDLTRPITATRAAMEEESARLDSLRGGLPLSVPLSSTGKTWVTSTSLLTPGNLKRGKKSGINYGFYSKSAPRPAIASKKWRVYQRGGDGPYGSEHTWGHTDYSQRGRLFSRLVIVKGGKYGPDPQNVDIDTLATDPETASLVHFKGTPMPVRHPRLPKFACRSGSQFMPGSGGRHRKIGSEFDDDYTLVWLTLAAGTGYFFYRRLKN
jgi:hypothetical protein